jgi:hypothetical protein
VAQLLTGLVAGLVSLIVAALTAFGGFRLQAQRLRTELRTEFMAEEAILKLLLHEKWRVRSFTEIKRRIRGFEDNELRKMLVSAGAVAFDGEKDPPIEYWGLRTRNEDRV